METSGTTKIRGRVRFLGLLLAASSALPAVTCFAENYTWNGSTTDWESADAYDNGGAKPSAGDTVTIPANKTATVDNDSIAFVSSLGKIYMPYSTGALTIDISTNATLGCQVTGMSDVSKEGSGTAIGTVTKRGAGELYLAVGGTSNSYRSQYYVNWEIEGGSIRMPTNSATSSSQLYFGAITVNEGQTLYTANPGRTRIMELWGNGMVTNESSGASNALDVYGFGRTAPSVFTGVIGGGLYMYSRGNIYLMGTNNTFKGGCWCWNYNSAHTYGTTGFKKIGMIGEASSVGAGDAFRVREYSGRFLYLGNGETTDRTFQFDQSSYCPCEFDAGAIGGITFTGLWQDFNTTAPMLNRIVITGSNTVECVLDNAFASYYGYRLTKKGSGTWRLAHNANRKNTGVVAVQDGTLKFESIAPAGTVCSLGKSTVLYEDYSDVKVDNRKVDYALQLGGDSSKTGTLEYVGAEAGFCTDRPLLVAGTGRFRASGGALTLGGVFAGDSGGTLIYDAADVDATNTLANVTDGTNGILSLVKEGAGTLSLSGKQSWGGTLDVREGTVLVNSHYEYWRFTMKESAYACTNRYPTARTVANKDTSVGLYIFQVSEFGLYDSNGTRLNEALVDKGSNPSSTTVTKFSATDLEPGEAAVETGSPYKYYLGNGSGRLSDLFDTALGSGNGDGIVIYCTEGYPYLDIPSRNLKIVMRLPQGSAGVKYYDICNARGSGGAYYGRCLTAYSLEGSVDGRIWEKVAEDDEAVIPASSSGWYSGDSTHKTLSVSRALALTNVTSVAVASGATLVAKGPVAPIKKLVLDVAGGGTIDGFEFVDEGELEIVGSFDGSVTIPVTIRNSETLSNVANWSVVSGGKTREWRVIATASGVTVSKGGLMMIVR